MGTLQKRSGLYVHFYIDSMYRQLLCWLFKFVFSVDDIVVYLELKHY